MSAATAMTSTKSRTRLFSKHTNAHKNNSQQAQWYQKISLPRTNTWQNDNQFYDFIKKYMVNIILLLYISMANGLFD